MQTITADTTGTLKQNLLTPQPRASAASDNRTVIEALVKSQIYQDYERSFGETTGLPVTLRPVESWQLPHHGRRNENPFCALLASKSRACAACLQVQQALAQKATHEPCTVTCQLGLSDTAVPIRVGDRLIGFLHAPGQVFRKKPGAANFSRVSQLVADWGIKTELEPLKSTYFSSRVLAPKQHDSVVKLLNIFAQHLSILSNQILVQKDNAEPPAIAKAKDYIRQHLSEDLSLGQVARAVNMSTFYFCKTFKKMTGLNFTEFVSRVRVEKAKNLLLNPNLRVSEIAYEIGFQSLTHFNRIFKKVMGQSPTEYRAQLNGQQGRAHT